MIVVASSNFNPRSPHRERPTRYPVANSIPVISIHAPLTGSDPETSHSTHTLRNFNPRSPHRERPLNFPVFNSTQHFNPRSPHRERPSTAWIEVRDIHFNPRSPHRERLWAESGIVPYRCISIHAPLTGSDPERHWRKSDLWHFNPRSPHRERRI